jgi:hypothetical protein
MEIQQKEITRLRIVFKDEDKESRIKVMDYLDEQYGKYLWKVVRQGPEQIAVDEFNMSNSCWIVDIENT